MNSQTKKSFRALIAGAWGAIAGERLRFWAFIFLFILAYTFDLLVPWAIGYTLDVFVKYGFTDDAMKYGALGIAAYTLLRLAHSTFHHLARYHQNTVAYTARMSTLTRIFSDLLKFPLRWHIGHHSGENLSKLHRSAQAVDSVIGTYIWQIIEGTVKVLFAGIALLTLDMFVAGNVLLLSLATIVAMILFNRTLTKHIRANNAFGNKINRIVVDYLINIVTVKTLSLEDNARRYLKGQTGEGLALSQRISKYMELKWGTTGIGYAFVIGTSLYIYFYRHKNGGEVFEVGQVYVMLNYLDRIFQAIGSFTGYYSGLIEAATAYEDAVEITEYAKPIPDRARVGTLDSGWKSLNLDHLTFSYVEGERVGLRDVAVQFQRGEKVALVGPSGGGKSTLLKILAGILQPEHCEASTDLQTSVPIEDVIPHCLLIPQEPEIFSETVRYNLTMGGEFDTKELTFFVSLCRLDALMAKLPSGWDSDLVEKGLNLSVGEKQRVALARGLLRASGKSVILLDEPTSSLDPKTEKEIFHGLLYHFADRTVISACHRLNLVPLFDKIVMVIQGSVVEVGTFNELLEKRGHFYRAWDDYQSKAAKEQIPS